MPQSRRLRTFPAFTSLLAVDECNLAEANSAARPRTTGRLGASRIAHELPLRKPIRGSILVSKQAGIWRMSAKAMRRSIDVNKFCR
jgi:hypothetical protein